MRRIFAILSLLVLVALVLLPTPATVSAGSTPQDVYLYGPGGTGGTTTVTAVSNNTQALGTSSSLDRWMAQSFQVSSGTLSQFTILFSGNIGTPVGTVSWSITSDNLSIPGTALASGSFTPTASATNTVTVSSGPFLSDSTQYWLVLQSTATQASPNNTWTLGNNTTNPYASGQQAVSTNAGAAWTITAGNDLVIGVTTVSGNAPSSLIYSKLAQSFSVGSAVSTSTIGLYLKKFNSPTGTMTLTVELDAGGIPSGVLAFSNATATYAESGLSTSYGYADFAFSPALQFVPDSTYWLVLTTNRVDATKYVMWGADSQCSINDMKHYNMFWGSELKTSLYTLHPYVPTATPTFTPSATFTPSPTFTPTPLGYVTTPLPSGTYGQVSYSITAGDQGLIGFGVFVAILCIYAVYLLLRQKPTNAT